MLLSKSLTPEKTDADIANLGAYAARDYSFESLVHLMMQDIMRHSPNEKPPIGYRVEDYGIKLIFE